MNRLCLLALLLATNAFAEETVKTMTMTWDASERADGYVVKRDSCDGVELYNGPETQYVEQIRGDVTYCLYAYNTFGESDPVEVTAWYEGLPPTTPIPKITVTITVEVNQ